LFNKIVIGIDQSYANTGLSIGSDNILRLVKSIHLDKGKMTNSDKRFMIRAVLRKVIEANIHKSLEMEIIIERIRLQSKGFINIDYIKSIGALNAVIVDTAREYEVKVFSVDTRCWKSTIVGTSKPLENNFGFAPEKYPTILFVKKLGFEESIMIEVSKQKKKGVFIRDGKRYVYNDDAADSAGICLYGFIPKEKQKLEEEH